MKIINCHIENFGHLSNIDCSFEEGYNSLIKENGWGKSTFAAFIKAMLYGLVGDKLRNDIDNERRRYRPWAGGAFGGSMTIENQGKRYVITRIFGDKSANDTFELRDAETNLISPDYTENIGEEIYMLNESSFVKTAFIGQDDVSVEVDAGISAKVGNIEQHSGDMTQFDKAIKKLENYLNTNSPNKKTGSLKKQKQTIADLKEEVKRANDLEQAIEKIQNHIDEQKQIKDNLAKQKEELQIKQKEISKFKDLEAKGKEYKILLEQHKARREELDAIKENFTDRIPTEDEVRDALSLVEDIKTKTELAASYALTAEESSRFVCLKQCFGGKALPDKEQMDGYVEELTKAEKLKMNYAKAQLSETERERLESYEFKYSAGIPDKEETLAISRKWNEKNDLKRQIEQAQQNISMYNHLQKREPVKNEAKSNGSAKIIMLIAGVIILAAGIGVAFSASQLAGIIIAVIGVVVTAASFAIKKEGHTAQLGNQAYNEQDQWALNQQQEIENNKGRVAVLEKEIEKFYSQFKLVYIDSDVANMMAIISAESIEYGRLKAKNEEAVSNDEVNNIETLEIEVKRFLASYSILEHDDNLIVGLHQLEKNVSEYLLLTQKEHNCKEVSAGIKTLSEQVKKFLEDIGFETERIEQELHSIGELVNKYNYALGEFQKADNKKIQFEKEHKDTINVMLTNIQGELSDTDSLEEVSSRLRQIGDENESINEILADYLRQLQDNQIQLDEITEQADVLNSLEEQYQEELAKYKLVQMTEECLTGAKDSFIARYMGPLLEAFNKYYSVVATDSSKSFMIDANVNITANECGAQRNVELLSKGYQDMVGICLRMALLDAMYQNEKAVVIFDDPFVNLDGDKLQGALKLIKKFAEEYQVIYFTCHPSRQIKEN